MVIFFFFPWLNFKFLTLVVFLFIFGETKYYYEKPQLNRCKCNPAEGIE